MLQHSPSLHQAPDKAVSSRSRSHGWNNVYSLYMKTNPRQSKKFSENSEHLTSKSMEIPVYEKVHSEMRPCGCVGSAKAKRGRADRRCGRRRLVEQLSSPLGGSSADNDEGRRVVKITKYVAERAQRTSIVFIYFVVDTVV